MLNPTQSSPAIAAQQLGPPQERDAWAYMFVEWWYMRVPVCVRMSYLLWW